MATATDVATLAQATVPWSKRQIGLHEARLLASLAARFDGGCILEVGTAIGFSAAVIALAAPRARITTLNPKENEYKQATANLACFTNVEVLPLHSADYLADYDGPPLDMVFVDGDHHYASVLADFGWWRWLKVGGLMLFHDYTSSGPRATPHVYDAVNEMARRLGRDLDVLDRNPDDGAGMAGFYRREGEGYGEKEAEEDGRVAAQG